MKDGKIDDCLNKLRKSKRDAFWELCTEVDKNLRQGDEIDSVVDRFIRYGSDVHSARLFVDIVEELSRNNVKFWDGWPDWVNPVADFIGRPLAAATAAERTGDKGTALWKGWPEWASDYACVVIYQMSKHRLLKCLRWMSVGAVVLAAAHSMY